MDDSRVMLKRLITLIRVVAIVLGLVIDFAFVIRGRLFPEHLHIETVPGLVLSLRMPYTQLVHISGELLFFGRPVPTGTASPTPLRGLRGTNQVVSLTLVGLFGGIIILVPRFPVFGLGRIAIIPLSTAVVILKSQFCRGIGVSDFHHVPNRLWWLAGVFLDEFFVYEPLYKRRHHIVVSDIGYLVLALGEPFYVGADGLITLLDYIERVTRNQWSLIRALKIRYKVLAELIP
jgi:hypothetical protein